VLDAICMGLEPQRLASVLKLQAKSAFEPAFE
jgi:hypothetical protein